MTEIPRNTLEHEIDKEHPFFLTLEERKIPIPQNIGILRPLKAFGEGDLKLSFFLNLRNFVTNFNTRDKVEYKISRKLNFDMVLFLKSKSKLGK